MSDGLIHVSSEELLDFQGKLRKLSQDLKTMQETISSGLSRLGQDWRDPKYDQFCEEFKASEQKLIEISERYREYADQHLQLKIEQARDYENS